jgi:hypothetical protein
MQNGTCTYSDSRRGIGSPLLASAASRSACSPKAPENCGAVGYEVYRGPGRS